MRRFLSGVALSLLIFAAAQSHADDAVPSDPQARWWKGNLHTHSLWSDGDDFPEMIAERYRVRDYNFLALTDHNVLSQGIRWMKVADVTRRGGDKVLPDYLARFGPNWVELRGEGDSQEVRLKPLDEFRALIDERGKFLLIPAEEISDRAEGVPVHMNASNLRDVITPLGGATVATGSVGAAGASALGSGFASDSTFEPPRKYQAPAPPASATPANPSMRRRASEPRAAGFAGVVTG